MPEITEQQHYELAVALADVPPLPESTHWLRQADALLASPVLAQMKREWQAEALREAADAWTQGGWSDVMLPKPAPPAVPVIAYSNRVGDWLRARAEASGREGERP